MKFIIDNAVSPRLAAALEAAGYDAVHVLAIGMESASDHEIIERAISESRVVITADADFSRILAIGSLARPSLILLRGDLPRRAGPLADLILTRLPVCRASLDQGAVVLLSPERTRIRDLPISPRKGR